MGMYEASGGSSLNDERTGSIESLPTEILTIWVSDMAGFTLSLEQEGLAHVLKKIIHMRNLARNIAPHRQGNVYKLHADDMFIVFPEPMHALDFTLELFHSLPPETQINVGIGYGPLCWWEDDQDFYGLEVNLASKLGEDMGRPGEVLLTRAAWGNLPEVSQRTCSGPFYVTLSHLEFEYFRWNPPNQL